MFLDHFGVFAGYDKKSLSSFIHIHEEITFSSVSLFGYGMPMLNSSVVLLQIQNKSEIRILFPYQSTLGRFLCGFTQCITVVVTAAVIFAPWLCFCILAGRQAARPLLLWGQICNLCEGRGI